MDPGSGDSLYLYWNEPDCMLYMNLLLSAPFVSLVHPVSVPPVHHLVHHLVHVHLVHLVHHFVHHLVHHRVLLLVPPRVHNLVHLVH